MKTKTVNPVSSEQAETIGLQALAFIASDPRHLADFMARTGISLDDLHQSAGERDVLAGALNSLLQDEPALLMFCANNAIEPGDITAAAHNLENTGTDGLA